MRGPNLRLIAAPLGILAACDTINARSATYLYPDTDGPISCGGGDDTVIADRSDPISSGQNGCEHVSKL